jgi:asparagine synthase (glutamine-hydrolysing)
MCGIAGEMSFAQRPGDVGSMLEAMTHRGPDGRGLHSEANIELGFRRLAIVDLSPAGHQPMTNEDESLWLVFNGEIYNYRELTAELKLSGHHFRSLTDSEVLLHGYEQWGERCIERLNGMFAFALWDSRRHQLFCGRDRFGVKPFYYAAGRPGQSLIFASEIKAILRHPRAPYAAANLDRVYDFLAKARLDHTNETCFAGIVQLPAAHYLLASEAGIRICRYWDLPDAPEPSRRAPNRVELRALSDEFGNLLEDSIRLRLHADVPVGSCLSGGVDSSAIVCVANRLLFSDQIAVQWHARGERQKTFSACYDDPRHDERAYMRAIAAATGAESHYVFPGREISVPEVIRQVVWHQDEPFGSTSILAQWHVMAAARKSGVTVMLDGQGADELLGGYHGYFGAALVDSLVCGGLDEFARDLLLYRRYHHPSVYHLARSMAHGVLLRHPGAQSVIASLTGSAHRSFDWLDPAFAAQHRVTDRWTPRHGSLLHATLYDEATRTSLPALLHWEDRNSMAFSIEARTPFLDYRLAEFAARLPNAALIRHGQSKRVVRDAMRGVIPERVRTRLDKKGFSTPQDTWFRTILRTWASDILNSPAMAARGFADVTKLKSLLAAHVTGGCNHSAILWRAISVELWARTFLDQPVGVTAPC